MIVKYGTNYSNVACVPAIYQKSIPFFRDRKMVYNVLGRQTVKSVTKLLQRCAYTIIP